MFHSIGTASFFAPVDRRRRAWSDLMAAVRLTVRAWMTRQSLPELPDRLLADIGVSRSAALAEAARRPWDLRPVYAGRR